MSCMCQNDPAQDDGAVAVIEPRGEVSSGQTSRGALTLANGSVYTGQWVGNDLNGDGVLVAKDGARYEGQWLKDVPNGRMRLTKASGATYEGDWRQGKFHGVGEYVTADGG